MTQSAEPSPIAITSDGQPLFPAVEVPPGSPQPRGVFSSGQPVWPVASASVPPGAPVPFGVTSDGAPVWAQPVSGHAARPAWKKKRVLIPAGIFALFLVVAVAGGEEEATDNLATTSSASSAPTPEVAQTLSAADTAAQEKEAADKDAADKAAADTAAADKAAAKIAAAAAQGTASQQNAYESAVDYLDYSAFSRKGLFDQLTSDYGSQFPAADAEFAVARLEKEGRVDWNAEATEAAKDYLDYSSFSRQGLLDQLTSEYGSQFTPQQAEHGVSQTGL